MSLARRLPDPPKRRASPRPVPCVGCSHKWARHDAGIGRCREEGCACVSYQEDLAADVTNYVQWNHEEFNRKTAEWVAKLRQRAARGDRFAQELADILSGTGNALRGDPAALATLGLGSDATPEQVKTAFRARALAAHPDHGGDPEELKALVQARDAALAAMGV